MFCFHQSVDVPVFQKSWLDADPGLSGEDDNGRQWDDSGGLRSVWRITLLAREMPGHAKRRRGTLLTKREDAPGGYPLSETLHKLMTSFAPRRLACRGSDWAGLWINSQEEREAEREEKGGRGNLLLPSIRSHLSLQVL